MRKYILLFCLVSTVSLAQPNYKITEVAKSLNQPWSLDFLPNGNYLVSLRSGSLRIVSNDGSVSEPIKNVPDTYVRSQGGFFDVLLDADFETNQTIYLSFADGDANANATTIVKAKLAGDTLKEVVTIFSVDYKKSTPMHYGGRMIIANDGTLYLTTGDGGSYREESQNPFSQLGALIRLNRDGSVPADNPFANGEKGDPFVQSFGHRNPQGLAYDSANDVIYLLDHGPKGGDEVNLIKSGANYGWPAATYGVNYSGATVSPYTSLPGMEDPLTYWVPSIAPSGLAFYNSDLFPEWKGNLFVGALKDRDVRRLEIENGQVVNEEILFEEIGERIRDVRVGPKGHLYILTDSRQGKLLRVSPE